MNRRLYFPTVLTAISAMALSGCGGSNTANKPALSPTESSATSSAAGDLPAELKSQYDGVPLKASAYESWPKVPGKWNVCYSESYVGNPWRVSVANEMKRLASEYQKAGLVSGFSMSVSDNDVARQGQQIRQFVDQGCSIIYVIAGSATGLNQAIDAAYAKKIPVVTIAGSVTTDKAVNVDSNYSVLGADLAKAAAGAGKNVIMVKGIEGSPIATQQNEAAKAAWKASGTKIVAEVNGNWTGSVTKQSLIKALATYPGKVDAVWTTGSETAIVAQTFKEAGKPIPLITGSISGDALGYWKQNPNFKFDGVALMPSWTAQTGFRIGMRILAGNGAKYATLMVPVPKVTTADLPGLYGPCMTVDSTSVFPVVAKDPLPSNLMDAYFTKAGEVGPFDYAKTPPACG